MAKKKRKPVPDKKITPEPDGGAAFAELISGKNAKWFFFAVYLLITIVLFHAFLFDEVMLFGSDTIPDGIYTRQYYKDYHDEFGGIPRWNPLILGGLPFIDAMHGDTFYPGAWLKFIMPLKRALGHKLIWHVFLAGVFMYLFLRTLNIRREAAFVGGIIYMLAPSFVTLLYSGHDAKMYVCALLPLAFALLETGMKTPRLYKFAGLGAVMGLLILTSHVQMAYYSYWAIGLYFIFRLIFGRDAKPPARAKKAAFFVLAVVIALTLGAVQLMPSYAFTTSQSVRAGAERTGYKYATSWSLHPEELMGMVVPSFPGFESGIGNRQSNTYWGRNPFKLNTEYHGIIPLLFALLALLTSRDRRVWFFFGIAILSLVYSLGANTPFYRLFYAFVPGIKNFRAPSMMIFLFNFSICVMAAHFFTSLLDRKTSLREGDKRLLYAAGVIAVASLIAAAAMSGLLDVWQTVFRNEVTASRTDIMHANIPFITRDLMRVALFAAAAFAGIWMFMSRKIGVTALVILTGLIAFTDESLVDGRFIRVMNPETNPGTAPDRVVGDILNKMKNRPPFRIFGGLTTTFTRVHSPNYYAMFGIQAADGHHNNELQTYELFKGGRALKNYTMHWLDDFEFKQDKISGNNFLRVAGVKYIIYPNQSGSLLIENPGALDRAFIVHDCVTVANDTLAVEMLKDTAFDPAKTAIIDKECELALHGEGADGTLSRVVDINYTGDGINLKVNLDAPGMLVVTENHVPYWRASIDGENTRIYRAYGTFMAVACPAGSHDVAFSFRSSPYETGRKLSLASFIFIIVACAISGIPPLAKRVDKR